METTNLWKKNLRTVPDDVWQQSDVRVLILADNGLTQLPSQIGNLLGRPSRQTACARPRSI